MFKLVIFVIGHVLINYFGVYKIKDAKKINSINYIVGVFFYGISAVIWFWLLRNYTVSIVVALGNSIGVVASTLVGYLCFKEKLNLKQTLGIVLVVVGIFTITFFDENNKSEKSENFTIENTVPEK